MVSHFLLEILSFLSFSNIPLSWFSSIPLADTSQSPFLASCQSNFQLLEWLRTPLFIFLSSYSFGALIYFQWFWTPDGWQTLSPWPNFRQAHLSPLWTKLHPWALSLACPVSFSKNPTKSFQWESSYPRYLIKSLISHSCCLRPLSRILFCQFCKNPPTLDVSF